MTRMIRVHVKGHPVYINPTCVAMIEPVLSAPGGGSRIDLGGEATCYADEDAWAVVQMVAQAQEHGVTARDDGNDPLPRFDPIKSIPI